MFWKRIVLDGFIPFSHAGIKHVEIDFEKPCIAIIGPNGVGKSSLLREMDPYPGTRTDYAKDGKIVKTFAHNGSIYELSSDFSNSTAPHSFKKDDMELNPSGTTDVQRDLVEEHFGMTGMINDLMSGNIHICAMQKAQRKQLFSSLYPSDLSFILEYYKKVCSQIRAFGNQIKLLQGREGSLLSSLIEESERNRLTEWKNGAQALITRIDQINLLLGNEIRSLESNEVLKKFNESTDCKSVIDRCNQLVNRFRTILVSQRRLDIIGEDVSPVALQGRYIEFNKEVQFLDKKKEDISSSLNSIRDELNKFIRLKNTPPSDKKDELSNELKLIQEEMTKLKEDPNWQNVPPVQQSKLEIVESLLPELSNMVSVIHPYVGHLLTGDEIQKLNNENDTLTFSCSSYMSEKVGIEGQLNQLKSRREMMTQNSYPKDCDRVCGLRATLEASVRDIDLQIKELTARRDKLAECLEVCNRNLDENKKKLQEIAPVIPIMKRLMEILSENYLTDLALDGEGFVKCLNDHCSEIPNRIVKGLNASKVYYRYKELFDRSESITNTLAMMKSNESINLSLNVINDIIHDKQSQLDSGILKLDDIDRKCQILKEHCLKIGELKDARRLFDELVSSTQDFLNGQIIKSRIEFDKQIISESTEIRNTLSERLREIEFTLGDQKRILDVLDTEIRPTMSDLRQQKIKWEAVEQGLSPTKGLPCIYLVRFINRLIKKANRFIKEIWYCDMELAYLDEKDNLDFTLGLILNKSSTVKDISLCSNGQKAIIDLAMTLALCEERGFLDQYCLRCDEIDAALTDEHRAKLVGMISRLLDEEFIKQLMLVNHFAIQTGINQCESVCLSTEGILVPGEINEHAVIS